MDADSSQFSTLVDIAEGKNLAVEGPPGTGKSQTIVNAIAAALFQPRRSPRIRAVALGLKGRSIT